MSIISSLLNLFKDLFKKLFDFISENWLLLLILVAAALLMNPALLSLVTTWLGSIGAVITASLGAAWSWIAAAVLEYGFFNVLGTAFLLWFVVDPDGATEAATNIISSAVETIGHVVSDVVSSVFNLGEFLSSPMGLATLAVGGYFLLKKPKKDDDISLQLNEEAGNDTL